MPERTSAGTPRSPRRANLTATWGDQHATRPERHSAAGSLSVGSWRTPFDGGGRDLDSAWSAPDRTATEPLNWTELALTPRAASPEWAELKAEPGSEADPERYPSQPATVSVSWSADEPFRHADADFHLPLGSPCAGPQPPKISRPAPGRPHLPPKAVTGYPRPGFDRIPQGVPLMTATTYPRRGFDPQPDGPFSPAQADTPPAITGLTYIRTLASGRQADILLYQARGQAQPLALKVLHNPLTHAQTLRLIAEVEAWAALAHPQVVRLFGAGVAADSRCYIGLAYHRRGSVARLLEGRSLSLNHVVRLGVQLADTLATVHRAGLLHLNLKPTNVLLDADGWPTLTDCGPAVRFATDPTGGLALPWSPPEIVQATAPPDERSDLYYLAATLWHLLMRRSPFETPGGDNSPTSVASRVCEAPPPTVERSDVPAALNSLLVAGLAKEPRHRPASAADFARALRTISPR